MPVMCLLKMGLKLLVYVVLADALADENPESGREGEKSSQVASLF